MPGIPRAGGFTITSTPEDAQGSVAGHSDPYLELAIQKSPRNPPAAWLWQPVDDILGEVLHVRVGGSFVWPPPYARRGAKVQRLVLVAGGVGINPLISILGHLHASQQMPPKVTLIYSTHPGKEINGSDVLFLDRVREISNVYAKDSQVELQLHLTGSPGANNGSTHLPSGTKFTRVTREDLQNAIGDESQRAATVCYICGPQKMTDEFVQHVQSLEGMDPRNVLCEKWW